MSSTQSISFRKRKEVDEIYAFEIEHREATFLTQNSVVMIEYRNEDVLIIAGKLPGLNGYYKNYPDVVERDREKQRQHEFAREQLELAKEYLSEYEPQASTATSNSGNSSMNDLYVTVPPAQRDEVVMRMWKMLNHLRERYVEFLQDYENESYHEYPPLEAEVLAVTRKHN